MHRCTSATAMTCALMVLLIGAARAAIEHAVIKADTRRLIHMSESFGFAKRGILELQVRDLKMYKERSSRAAPARDINYDRFGFFVVFADADAKLEQWETPTDCSLDEAYVKNLFLFSDGDVQKLLLAGKNASLAHVMNRNFTFPRGGSLTLHFANCESDVAVSFEATMAMYNVDKLGRRVYLSVGWTELTTVYWVSVIQLICGCWLLPMLWLPRRDAHPHRHCPCLGCRCRLACTTLPRLYGCCSFTRPGTTARAASSSSLSRWPPSRPSPCCAKPNAASAWRAQASQAAGTRRGGSAAH
jgi:hypothetical protein